MNKLFIAILVTTRKIRLFIFKSTNVDIFYPNNSVSKENLYFLRFSERDYYSVDARGVWEENRFNKVLLSALEYNKSKDETIIAHVKNEILNWEKDNKYLYGLNWLCAMEAAIRLSNLALVYLLIKDYIISDKEFYEKFLNIIYNHNKFIIENPEVYLKSPLGNHYLTNIAGLIYASLVFPVLKTGKWKLKFLIKELEMQIQKQVLEDGVSFENSMGYHRFVLEVFIYTGVLLEEYNFRMSEEYWGKVEKMISFVKGYSKPDGTAPNIGDSDDGYWHKVRSDISVNNHLYLSKLFNIVNDNLLNKHRDRKIALKDFIMSLYNSNLQNSYEKGVFDFTNGGIYFYKNENLYINFNTRNSHTSKIQPHKHNDILSFELCVNELSFIEDRGTYTYTKDKEMRNVFRSTSYHNTIQVGDYEQQNNASSGFFALQRDGDVSTISNSDEDSWMVKSTLLNSLYGYISRTITYFKKENILELKDEILLNSDNIIKWFFHLHKDVSIDVEKEFILMQSGDKCVKLKYPKDLNISVKEEKHSPRFNYQEKAGVIEFSSKNRDKGCSVTFVFDLN
jgi:hypothetical protein